MEKILEHSWTQKISHSNLGGEDRKDKTVEKGMDRP